MGNVDKVVRIIILNKEILGKVMWIKMGISVGDNQWIRILFVSGMGLEEGGVGEEDERGKLSVIK